LPPAGRWGALTLPPIENAYKTEEEVVAFNRDLKFNRELTAARRLDQIKREVLQARKQPVPQRGSK
jgi:hypothetical protein